MSSAASSRSGRVARTGAPKPGSGRHRYARRTILSLGLGLGLVGITASTALTVGPAEASEPAPFKIVATTGMIADAAARIGGEAADVTGLMASGVDPHGYRQTRSDISKLLKADLVLWNGLFLEAQMEDFLEELAAQKPVIAVAEAIPVDQRMGHDDYDNRFDPHVWMDAALWSKAVTAIGSAMIEARPESANVFRSNLDAYLAEIAEVGAYASKVLATVPEKQRVLLTAHDAFNYFGRAHNYTVLGIQGISTESEAGLKRIADLVDYIVQNKVSAVFVESSVSDRNIRAIIEGAAARGHEVSIGGSLFSDAMGEPGQYEGTYIGLQDHNATIIARALGGEAPETGMQGLLGAGS
jgi:manganese/zinc/iron transport system substrate-binding protein